MTDALKHTINMALFDKIKTNNMVIDTILSTIFISIFGLVFASINSVNCSFFWELIMNIVSSGSFTSKIIITGKRCTALARYGGELYVNCAYSETFNAVLYHITQNINTNNSEIKEIKELYSSSKRWDSDGSDVSNINFLVTQIKPFTIDKDVLCKISSSFDDSSGSTDDKQNSKIENFKIELFSHNINLSDLIKYLDNIVVKYKINIKQDRSNKQFVYSVEKPQIKEEDITPLSYWNETVFVSNRTFDNLFFEDKEELLSKIDFFLNNKPWYDERGLPYTLGIGLHGTPGTGKTSFIKALANKTKRDIVILPLKNIKTSTLLKNLFFEDRYTALNESNSKTFDKKIIVFEDIDCIGDIVKERKKSEENLSLDIFEPLDRSLTDNTNADKSIPMIKYGPLTRKNEDPITLDDFLNLWDGIVETPGRIIIITSNRYEELDKALVRPGRIDIAHKFKNVSRTTLQDIHYSLFKSVIPCPILNSINSDFYSPAEIINIYLTHASSEQDFLERLVKNQKL